jgi:hypothetical protein
MHGRYIRAFSFQLKSAVLIAVVLLAAGAARAQSSLPRVEIGGHLSVIDLRKSIEEKPPGVGGRFSYNLTDLIALDAEATYFSTSEVDLNRTQGLFGVKAGKRLSSPPIGLFAKARPGFMRFHGERRPGVSINGTTKFALDLGGVFELYPAEHIIVRIDVGDTVIFYNQETIRRLSLPGGPSKQIGTEHNLQAAFGISFRF